MNTKKIKDLAIEGTISHFSFDYSQNLVLPQANRGYFIFIH